MRSVVKAGQVTFTATSSLRPHSSPSRPPLASSIPAFPCLSPPANQRQRTVHKDVAAKVGASGSSHRDQTRGERWGMQAKSERLIKDPDQAGGWVGGGRPAEIQRTVRPAPAAAVTIETATNIGDIDAREPALMIMTHPLTSLPVRRYEESGLSTAVVQKADGEQAF